MDWKSDCIDTVTRLLHESPRLAAARKMFSSFVVTADIDEEVPQTQSTATKENRSISTRPLLPPSDGTTTADDHQNHHQLHVSCRHSSSAGRQVDGLGRTGILAGRGFFQDPPPRIVILADRCATTSMTASGEKGGGGGGSGGGVKAKEQTVSSSSSSSSPSPLPPPTPLRNNLTIAAKDVEELLAHEMVHAIDFLVHKMDLQSCGGLACSEVRAAASAECQGVWPSWLKRRCIRTLSRTSSHMVFPELGGKCVDAVFDACVDTALSDNPAAGAFGRAMELERNALKKWEEEEEGGGKKKRI